ncbi:hypothetical protein TgHK011_000105 [Trichoderma gracile]|nr:hypothetical protein TgHK011_000105 [Trichoderma gracile]
MAPGHTASNGGCNLNLCYPLAHLVTYTDPITGGSASARDQSLADVRFDRPHRLTSRATSLPPQPALSGWAQQGDGNKIHWLQGLSSWDSGECGAALLRDRLAPHSRDDAGTMLARQRAWIVRDLTKHSLTSLPITEGEGHVPKAWRFIAVGEMPLPSDTGGELMAIAV